MFLSGKNSYEEIGKERKREQEAWRERVREQLYGRQYRQGEKE